MPSPSSPPRRKGRRMRRQTSKGRKSMQSASRARAKNRRMSVKSKKTRAAKMSVDELATRFGKIKPHRKSQKQGTMSMASMFDALPTTNPFRNRMLVRSKSHSPKKKKSSRKKRRSPRGRRFQYTMARRRIPKRPLLAPATF